MANLISSYFIPSWFVGLSILIEFSFAIVSLMVSLSAYKIYKISNEKNIKIFSIGFLLISMSYFLHILINWFFVSQIARKVTEISLEKLQLTALLGIYLYMAFLIIGLITIFYANFKSNKSESYFLMAILGLSSVFTYINYIAAFHITAVIILSFINFHYFKDYTKNKNHRTFLVFIAFISMLLSHAVFIFPVTYQEYVTAHLLGLVAYGLILTSLFRMRKIKNYKRKIP